MDWVNVLFNPIDRHWARELTEMIITRYYLFEEHVDLFQFSNMEEVIMGEVSNQTIGATSVDNNCSGQLW